MNSEHHFLVELNNVDVPSTFILQIDVVNVQLQ